MLQGNVEVLADVLMRCHNVQKLVGHASGLQVHYPEPRFRIRFRKALQERSKVFSWLKVKAPNAGVLGDKHDFLCSRGNLRLYIGNDFVVAEAMVASANVRNGAERAETVAPIGDFHVLAGRILEFDLNGITNAGNAQQAIDDLDNVVFFFAGDKPVGFGKLIGQIVTETGGHASANHELGATCLHRIKTGDLEHSIKAFLDCRLNERAGVDHDNIAWLLDINDGITRANQILLHAGAVGFVFCASQRQKGNVFRHQKKNPSDSW